MVPILKLNVSIIPKCKGVIPNAVQTGSKMGVKIKMAGVRSMKVPTNNNNKLMTSKIMIGLSEIPIIAFAINVGISVKDITQAKIFEAPIRNIIIADNLALLTRMSYKSLILIVL